jgi:hypothetical protein
MTHFLNKSDTDFKLLFRVSKSWSVLQRIHQNPTICWFSTFSLFKKIGITW